MWRRFLKGLPVRAPGPEDGGLERLRADLAHQSSAAQVALALADHLVRLSGAAGVSVRVHAGPEHPAIDVRQGDTRSAARQVLPLVAAGSTLGEACFHGLSLAPRARFARALAYGAVAVQNALLAEQALAAEIVSTQAKARRDLQHRLTWMASSQICRLLEETQGLLAAARAQVEVAPSPELAQRLAEIRARLQQLEAFVHANLDSVRASEAP